MRTLELALLSAVLLAGILLPRAAARRGRRTGIGHLALSRTDGLGALPALGAAAVVTAALVAQRVVEGGRWQLLPASIAAAISAGAFVLAAVGARIPLGRSLAAIVLVAGTVSGLGAWALPVTLLPRPDGPHRIGTTTIVLLDPSRTDDAAATPSGPARTGTPRELVVQLWYPADPTAPSEPGPLMPSAVAFADVGGAALGLPAFTLGHLGVVPGHATPDAPALDRPLPVVVLAHGWTGFRTAQADLAEHLASHGYIVAAADHTLGALVTTFPDGRAIPFDPALLPEFGTVEDAEYARRSRALVAMFAEDIELVLRALDQAPPDALAGRIDPTRIALIGHSTGGGAAVLACSRTPACGAVVGFDPWVAPLPAPLLTRGLGAPLLTLRTEDWRGRPNDDDLAVLHRAQRRRGSPEALIGIEGALHRDFTLVSALSPLGDRLGLAGTTPGGITREVARVWTRSFLDHHLLGSGVDPLVDPPLPAAPGVAVREVLEVTTVATPARSAP